MKVNRETEGTRRIWSLLSLSLTAVSKDPLNRLERQLIVTFVPQKFLVYELFPSCSSFGHSVPWDFRAKRGREEHMSQCVLERNNKASGVPLLCHGNLGLSRRMDCLGSSLEAIVKFWVLLGSGTRLPLLLQVRLKSGVDPVNLSPSPHPRLLSLCPVRVFVCVLRLFPHLLQSVTYKTSMLHGQLPHEMCPHDVCIL